MSAREKQIRIGSVLLGFVLVVSVTWVLQPRPTAATQPVADEQHEESADREPAPVISPDELLDMIYGYDVARPAYPNDDGSIPLTRELLLHWGLFGAAESEDDSFASPTPNSEEDALSHLLSCDQVVDLHTIGWTPLVGALPNLILSAAVSVPEDDDVVAAGCAFRIKCDKNGENCRLECSVTCPAGETCAQVTRRAPGGGTTTTCECVPLAE